MLSTTSYEKIDLSVVIVNFNSGDELLVCLESLVDSDDPIQFEVIVVDNGSTGGCLDEAERRFSNVQYVRAGENLGFAGGCNLGLSYCRGRHVMLLNPDTQVQKHALRLLVEALDAHHEWGIVGPRMTDQLDRLYPAARRFPTPWRLFCETTRLSNLLPHTRAFAAYLYGESSLEALNKVEQIEGSALVISQRTREIVGDLDPQFFIFFEEVDWCKRVHEAGLEMHVVQEAVIRHERSTSMSKSYSTIRQIHAQSAMKYFLKHHGHSGLRSLRRWMIAGLLIREIGMWIAGIFGAGELAKLRARTARLEREVYRRGLES